MRTPLRLAAALASLAVAGCSLQQTKVVQLPPPSGTKTVIVHPNQALDWNVRSSYFASSSVQLSYGLCPGQHLAGKPQVVQNAHNVSITLWANQATCATPAPQTITVQLGRPLGNRALTNPALLQ
ncbi:MAG: hypothetical protein ACTHOG_13585 [Marmoricola sp.]